MPTPTHTVYTSADLQRWITEWEGPGLEIKSSVQKNVGETISAFANTYGGILVFGVEPKKKGLDGLQNTDEESQRLRHALDQCKPNPKPEQQFLRHDGKTFIVLKIEAFPYSVNPCFFGDHCFVRQGTTNLKLIGGELIEFLKKRTLLNFEESRVHGSVKDLDLVKIKRLLKVRKIETDGLDEDELRRLLVGLQVASQNGEFFLKNAALLFFAKEPQRFYSNLEVRIVRYASLEPDLSTIRLDRHLYGSVPDLITQSFQIISENIGKTFTLQGPERKEILDYPPDSLREAITNALGHRDYYDTKGVLIEILQDRIQITNPGGLLAGQTDENFDRTPQHRNPICYRLLRDLGLGEGLGLGVRLIRRQFRERGLPDPEFYTLGNMFQVVFYNHNSKRRRNPVDFETPRRKSILAYLKKNSKLKSADFAKIAGVSIPTLLGDLNELIKQGKVRRVGLYRGAYYEIGNLN
jgi:ATP-dependent DNA helicase RecG